VGTREPTKAPGQTDAAPDVAPSSESELSEEEMSDVYSICPNPPSPLVTRLFYRGTLLIRNNPPLGPTAGPCLRFFDGSGGGAVSYERSNSVSSSAPYADGM
jgi:hypothetical protein